MVEGSMINWGGHETNTTFIVNDTLNFYKIVAKALAFSFFNRKALVVNTADHETGGVAVEGGDIYKGKNPNFLKI